MKKTLVFSMLLSWSFCQAGVNLKGKPGIYWRYNLRISDAIQSKCHENLYWVINGDGIDRMVYAVDARGHCIKGVHGFKLKQSVNHNWTDISVSNAGYMAIADFTDANGVQPLIYIFREPDSPDATEAFVSDKIVITFPPYLYDNQIYTDMCPAGIFYRNNQLYLMSNGENGYPNVYKVDKDSGLTYHSTLRADGEVVALESDGKDRIALVMEGGVSIYKPNYDMTDWVLESRIPCSTKDVVGVSIDDRTVTLTDRKGKMSEHSIPVSNYRLVTSE